MRSWLPVLLLSAAWLAAQVSRIPTPTTPGTGDASTNTSSSVDSEIAVFSGTAGKTIKRATGSGLAKVTSGVLGIAGASDLPATNLPAPGTAVTVALPHGYAICTGTCTVTLPAPTAAGDDFCVWNDVAVSTAITISGHTGVFFSATDLSAYGTTAGSFSATAAAGNKVCMVARDTTHWHVLSFTGTWTAN